MLLSLLVGSALAQAAPATPPPEGALIYITGRASAAFPANYPQTTMGYGLELGGIFKDHNAIGIRAFVLVDPPPVMGDDTPAVAFGPAFTWSYLLPIGTRLQLYPTASLGVGIGKSPVDGANQVLPYLQGGFGAQVNFKVGHDTHLYAGPEVGFVPFAMAPYFAVNVGSSFSGTK